MKNYQSGFSLVAAIFLLVVIAALGTFAVTISTSQQQGSAMDVLGSRAYQAAKAGIEWSIYQITRGGATCATLAQPAMPAGTQLSAFAVAVVCNSTDLDCHNGSSRFTGLL
jgi:MSHA biogenesis protein MshP